VSLRILSYNIERGGKGREEKIAEIIRSAQPDLVLLQEAYDAAVVMTLGKACGMSTWASSPGQSVAFLSRTPVERHAWHRVWFARRAYLEVVLQGGQGRVFGVHLSAIHSNVTEQRRSLEMRSLLRGLEPYKDQFHVVTGDFNTLAPGEKLDINKLPPRLRAFAWITGGRIRWTTIQIMLNRGYVDAHRILHGTDSGYTFPTWSPHIRLDYAFVPSAFAKRMKGCEVIRSVASDHFPLLTTAE